MKRNALLTRIIHFSCVSTCVLAGLLTETASALAQPTDGGIPAWVEQDPFSSAADEDDPLSIDRRDQLEMVSPTTVEEETRRPVPVRHGEALSAISGVTEARHDVTVTLAHGLADVQTSLRFVSRARRPAEVRYRLAVPEGANLVDLEVCRNGVCRTATRDTSRTSLGPFDHALRVAGRGRTQAPIAHAAIIEDGRGHAVWLRAAAVGPVGRALHGVSQAGGELEVRVRYIVAAPVRGGRVRLVLPARGRDERAARGSFRVVSAELREGLVGGIDAVERAVLRDVWQSSEITAQLDIGTVGSSAWNVRCGDTRCARVRVVAPTTNPPPRDVIVLLDASPSTSGRTRARMAPALGSLIAGLPSGTRLRVATFAARSEAVVSAPTEATEVSLLDVARALERPLGSATRFEAAWATVEPWVRGTAAPRRPLILLIGDGALTTSPEGRDAMAAAQASGAELAVLNVADRPSTRMLRQAVEAADGVILDVGAEAARATAGHGMDPLIERLGAALSPIAERDVRLRIGARTVSLGALRAGEELVWEGQTSRSDVRVISPRGVRAVAPPAELALAIQDRLTTHESPIVARRRLAAVPDDLSALSACSTSTPVRAASSPVAPSQVIAPADTRRCRQPSVPEASSRTEAPRAPGTVGRSTLLELMRRRIVPVARRCFRQDRRGRGGYAIRAVFEFTLADREVVDSRITGANPELAQCLTVAVDGLELPPFDGAIHVRYPLHTSAHMPAPTLTLSTDVADAVDAVTQDED